LLWTIPDLKPHRQERLMKNAAAVVAIAAAALILGGCGSETAGGDPMATAATEAPATPTSEPTTERPAPTREEVPTFQIGEEISRPTANLVVNVLEERDVIQTGSYSDDYTPNDGERLWYVDITWTNNLPEAVEKECHGPYSMNLQAFDVQGREMLMVDQPGYIEGQECSTGLMQGQTGTWLSAFRGLDDDLGWLVFDDYNGEEAVVTMDPNMKLYYDN